MAVFGGRRLFLRLFLHRARGKARLCIGLPADGIAFFAQEIVNELPLSLIHIYLKNKLGL